MSSCKSNSLAFPILTCLPNATDASTSAVILCSNDNRCCVIFAAFWKFNPNAFTCKLVSTKCCFADFESLFIPEKYFAENSTF